MADEAEPAAPGGQMSTEAAAALEVMGRLAAELRNRQPVIARRLDYFRGAHPLHFASEEFAGYFGSRFAGFSDNWCAPVVSSPAERMNVLGIRLGSEQRPDAELARVWRVNGAERGSSEAFAVLLAAARSFALVWGNPDDESTPRITWERPDQAIVGYDAETGQARAGLKLWRDEWEGHEFATLYTPEYLWKWQRKGAGAYVHQEPSAAVLPSGGWEPRHPAGDDAWPLPNPMGAVPLVELRNQTLLDDAPISDIDGVIAMQDATNLVWAYLMNGLDYATLPQRVVTGADMPKIPILDATGQQVGERPLDLDTLVRERILWVPDPNASTSEWSAARLDVFSAVIERAVEHIAAQSRTPPHYLIGRVANLAAEALTAAETGLVSKTNERIVYADPSIREIYALTAQAAGDEDRAAAARAGTVMWADTQFRALSQKVDALLKLRQMGFPFAWLAEQYGLEPPEVERVLAMREAEARLDPIGAISAEIGRTQPAAGAGTLPLPFGVDPFADEGAGGVGAP
ncbi:phage portal protein [Allonocardiopsis opalescens]|uniref:SPP1 Gp6-like portal protein n=1 Tax=Allonocardiopsis opalescens TaxID=1144618 RepID=A0A2T0PPL0_9ACTN|nr:phage portal protein [Allonocardiopsis opalescens]PRX90833.1 SPP1 Gp6-like portal protein [Allonocardiopsis opalescens]